MTNESRKENEPANLTDSKRQPCEIWSRVMGYFRPVSEYNQGKKAEFYARKYFAENKAIKRKEL